MTTLRLRRLVPQSVLAGRWLLVLVCYLDDSGKDPQSRITNLAGYIADEDNWKAFESEVEPWFAEFKVSILRGKNLHDTDGEFANWPVLRKQAFIARVYQVLSRHIPLGIGVAVVKETYEQWRRERGSQPTVSPYTFCFQIILDRILRNVLLGKRIRESGLSFVIESGHENNAEVEQKFHATREQHKDELGSVLRSIRFVPKEHSRAIQVADLLSFYSRRYGAAIEAAPLEERNDIRPAQMINIMTERIPHSTFVATDFGPNIPNASRFFAGPLDGEQRS
jgi:Protein of unknown function (DUF3800)